MASKGLSMSKGLFLQNVIAIIWDFDQTLSPHYMQEPVFDHYGVDARKFWEEVRSLPAFYARAGIKVQQDTCYLGHLLTYVQCGLMGDLSNAKLRELGAHIRFHDGVPEIFFRLRGILEKEEFKESDLHLEHYVVSTGLAELVRGSAIAEYLSGIWASEFIESPALPGLNPSDIPKPGPITQIAGFLDHTTKTRAIFEINKGINKLKGVSVNDTIPEDERRVPFRNMIYIADGPSDVPSFSVIRKHGGLAYAVYPSGSAHLFAQVDELLSSGRVDAYGPADYREGSQTDMWLQRQVSCIAQRMMKDRIRTLESSVGRGPHFSE